MTLRSVIFMVLQFPTLRFGQSFSCPTNSASQCACALCLSLVVGAGVNTNKQMRMRILGHHLAFCYSAAFLRLLLPRLHDEARCLLDVCSMSARCLLDRVNGLLQSQATECRHYRLSPLPAQLIGTRKCTQSSE